jgi:hypothetical protein
LNAKTPRLDSREKFAMADMKSCRGAIAFSLLSVGRKDATETFDCFL